ncbi:carbohydrate ABC transporter permease [Plantactinospora sp. GCM10030261]|uniref:carbohydrate ABC transporter permease n=1 Tax=Plantactinospora sp. GCM10030261 TaxID=3273420 RepID=UPI00361B2204
MRRLAARGGPYAGFALFAVVFGLPVYWILLSAFLPADQLLSEPPTYFTTRPTGETVQRTSEQVPIWTYALNSALYAVGSALLAVALAFFAAYAFARLRFRGGNLTMLVLLLTMALPQIATTIPLFQLYNSLGLVDTMHGLILLQASLMIPMTVWLMVSFVKQIPRELEEAAHVDGTNFAQMLYVVIWPLLKPALVTLFLVNLIMAWNELFYPLVFSNSVDTRTLTIGLIQLTQVNSGAASRPWDLMSTLSVFMIVPIILLVVFGQRRIIAGLTAGAGK